MIAVKINPKFQISNILNLRSIAVILTHGCTFLSENKILVFTIATHLIFGYTSMCDEYTCKMYTGVYKFF